MRCAADRQIQNLTLTPSATCSANLTRLSCGETVRMSDKLVAEYGNCVAALSHAGIAAYFPAIILAGLVAAVLA